MPVKPCFMRGFRRAVKPPRSEGSALSGWLRRTPDDYTFTTFSQGLHRCPGERTALVVVACVLAHLLDGPFRTKLRPPVPAPSFERATLAQRDGPVAAVMDSPGEFSADTNYTTGR